jgi:hypothetical protein
MAGALFFMVGSFFLGVAAMAGHSPASSQPQVRMASLSRRLEPFFLLILSNVWSVPFRFPFIVIPACIDVIVHGWHLFSDIQMFPAENRLFLDEAKPFHGSFAHKAIKGIPGQRFVIDENPQQISGFWAHGGLA